MGWKVVRDKDPEVCAAIGVSGRWRRSATPCAGLTKKLFEEASEWGEENYPGELYDLLDVIAELLYRLDRDGTARRLHEEKVARRGGFTQCMEWNPVPLAEDDQVSDRPPTG